METQEKVVGEGFKRLQLHPFETLRNVTKRCACNLQPGAYRARPPKVAGATFRNVSKRFKRYETFETLRNV